MNNDHKESLKKLVNNSGFLFQLRVEHEVRQTFQSHGWKVITREHAWRDTASGKEGFIDLVLGDSRTEGQRIVVECKRPREGSWVFLVPEQSPPDVLEAAYQWTYFTDDKKSQATWYNFKVNPPSPEAEFCIVRGGGEGDKGMLERLAASLLTALDGLATEELHLRAQQGFFWPRVYFPFIVTTAQLYVCRFKLADISLNDGTIPDGQIEPVPFTRFRKSLTTKSNSNLSPRNLGEANRDRERTVFVVQASEFIKVLKDWNPNFPPGKPPW